MAESRREEPRQESRDDGRAQRLYEAWLAASAPGANHPWDSLSDDDKSVWRKVLEALK